MVFDIANFYKNSKNYEEAINTILQLFHHLKMTQKLNQTYYTEEEVVMSD